MDVIVLATSVESPVQVSFLAPVLNSVVGAGNWNFALDDCDRVLRIVSRQVKPNDAILLIRKYGFECRELE
jgi:hypothetical protein